MPHKDPKARAAYMKRWRETHPNYSKEYNAKYYWSNPDRARAEALKWHNENRERSLANKKKNYANTPGSNRKRYGLTEEHYQQMLAEQGHCCKICKKALQGGLKTHVDHSHSTGKVRAVLCNRCNSVLGFSLESPEILAATICYIAEHSELKP